MKLPPAPLPVRRLARPCFSSFRFLLLAVVTVLGGAAGAAAQERPARAAGDSAAPVARGRPGEDSAYYRLLPERHGASFFPRVRHPEVEYVAGERLEFDRYHSGDVM